MSRFRKASRLPSAVIVKSAGPKSPRSRSRLGLPAFAVIRSTKTSQRLALVGAEGDSGASPTRNTSRQSGDQHRHLFWQSIELDLVRLDSDNSVLAGPPLLGRISIDPVAASALLFQ